MWIDGYWHGKLIDGYPASYFEPDGVFRYPWEKYLEKEKMTSNYILHKTQSSFCPHCNELVFLLCDKDGKEKSSFYICWNCHFVGEIGKGPVKEEHKKE